MQSAFKDNKEPTGKCIALEGEPQNHWIRRALKNNQEQIQWHWILNRRRNRGILFAKTARSFQGFKREIEQTDSEEQNQAIYSHHQGRLENEYD